MAFPYSYTMPSDMWGASQQRESEEEPSSHQSPFQSYAPPSRGHQGSSQYAYEAHDPFGRQSYGEHDYAGYGSYGEYNHSSGYAYSLTPWEMPDMTEMTHPVGISRPAETSRPRGKDSHAGSSASSGTNVASNGAPEYSCCHPGCNYKTARDFDLKRHMNKHCSGESFPCPYTWCGRDVKPFSKEEHLKQHLRNVHMQDIPKRKGISGREKP